MRALPLWLASMHAYPPLISNESFMNVCVCVESPKQGEIEPTPYFYQNLGEAEMVVSIFCFMRLMGYPAEKITILSTYNGQKHLIRDVVERRCAQHPLFGRPAKVRTACAARAMQRRGRLQCTVCCMCLDGSPVFDR